MLTMLKGFRRLREGRSTADHAKGDVVPILSSGPVTVLPVEEEAVPWKQDAWWAGCCHVGPWLGAGPQPRWGPEVPTGVIKLTAHSY